MFCSQNNKKSKKKSFSKLVIRYDENLSCFLCYVYERNQVNNDLKLPGLKIYQFRFQQQKKYLKIENNHTSNEMNLNPELFQLRSKLYDQLYFLFQ